MHLTLLSRAYCHLCDEMEAALRPLIGTTPLRVVDVDAPEHAALEAQYGEWVPVLFAGEPGPATELCRVRLDAGRVVALLAEAREIR
jgi:thioredoxin reductase (NADPH)